MCISPDTLTDGVPKVTEALRGPFWHFLAPRLSAYLELYTPSCGLVGTSARGALPIIVCHDEIVVECEARNEPQRQRLGEKGDDRRDDGSYRRHG